MWGPDNTHLTGRIQMFTAAESYTVLVVTRAVPPSSVAGSGILCSLTIEHEGSPLLFSDSACFVVALLGLMSSTHCKVLCVSRRRWKGQRERWLFLPDGNELLIKPASVFWRGSCSRCEFSVMQTVVRQYFWKFRRCSFASQKLFVPYSLNRCEV